MPKILSIDFDIIMYPCINLYNEHIFNDKSFGENWNFLNNDREIDLFVNYDAKLLLKIANLIKFHINLGTPINFLNNHDEIVDDLKTWDCFENENPFEIINVDFHHDVLYYPDNKPDLTVFHDYNCANWLGYLFYQNKTKKISWYKAYNSQVKQDIIDNIDVIENISMIDNLFEENFDYIYFIKSPNWIPYKFHHLYDLIVTLLNK